MRALRISIIFFLMALSFLFASCAKDESLLVTNMEYGPKSLSHLIQRGDASEGQEHMVAVLTGLLNDGSIGTDSSVIYAYVMNYIQANTNAPQDYAFDMGEYNLSFDELVQLKLLDPNVIDSAQASFLIQFNFDVRNINSLDPSVALVQFENLLDELESDLNSTGLNQDQANYFSLLLTAMQANARGLIQVAAARGGFNSGCAGAVLGALGLAAAVITAPATGGLSVWYYVGAITAGAGTGIGIAECFPITKK